MMLIGVDPHKSTHTATALDPATNSDQGSIRIDASHAGYRQLLVWARQWFERSWAVENAEGLGHHLAQWLVAAGEAVVDVAPSATARARQLSRGGRRKNDRIDAAAAASVAAVHGDARPVYAQTHADSLALLDERRKTLSENRTRSVNQLHALLRELLPGGVPTDLTAAKATTVLRGLRPTGGTDRVRKRLAKDLVADIKRYDTQLSENATAMSDLPAHHTAQVVVACPMVNEPDRYEQQPPDSNGRVQPPVWKPGTPVLSHPISVEHRSAVVDNNPPLAPTGSA